MRLTDCTKLALGLIVTILIMAETPTLAEIPPGYTVADLGTLGGGAASAEREVTGINSKGEVVGIWNTPAGWPHAFLWLPEPAYGLPAGMNDLGARPGYGSDSRAYAINDSGRVACTAVGACYWQNGYWMSLGGEGSSASGMNNSGRIAGMAEVGSGPVNEYHAYLWAPGEDLGDIGGRRYANARDINEIGDVVGYALSSAPGANLRAFLLEGATVTWVGTFPDGGDSYALGANDSKQVAGWAVNASYDQRAFLWQAGVMTDLGTLGGRHSRCAGGINSDGLVVGWSDTSTLSVEHAFVWDAGTMYDLNDLIPLDSGWVLEKAGDINDLGQIAGKGYYNGEMRPFLLTPVPEPATLALVGLSGAGMLLRRRAMGR